jgi:hypothetical protein
LHRDEKGRTSAGHRSRGGRTTKVHALTNLERKTARRYRDVSLDCELDLSWISPITTTNGVSKDQRSCWFSAVKQGADLPAATHRSQQFRRVRRVLRRGYGHVVMISDGYRVQPLLAASLDQAGRISHALRIRDMAPARPIEDRAASEPESRSDGNVPRYPSSLYVN